MLGSVSKVEVLAACSKLEGGGQRNLCVRACIGHAMARVRRHCRVSSVVTFGP